MRRAWSVADNRAAEGTRLAQVPDGALMQRAAAGLAAVCARELRRRTGGVSGRRVVLLVGAGNNGGDALWAGARLAARGARVDAVLLAGLERTHAEGLAALRAAGGRAAPAGGRTGEAGRAVPADTRMVIDGIVGLGGSAGLREQAAAVVAGIPSGVCMVAVDLPSGVDPDTGELPPPGDLGRARHVVADVTVTFGALKPCLLLPPASRAAGRVELVDIGLGPLLTTPPAIERLQTTDAAALWPVPAATGHKYARGVLGVIAGSDTYPGAAVLAMGGALRAGVGMARYLGPAHARRAVLAAWPEAVPAQGQVQAWLVGPGLDPGTVDGQADAVRAALASGLPVVADAGALPLLPPRCSPVTLITPHAGELAALLTTRGEATGREAVEARPLEHARRAAELTGATVLLKGSTTLIVPPDGPVRSQADGTPWLATAGAGDVLAGVIGALLAAGLDPLDAGSLAALVHGRSARLAADGGPITAGDVAHALPAAARAVLSPGTLIG
jgi:hydroxyethylthiazole kinase-like uncharacterized protein yjeF